MLTEDKRTRLVLPRIEQRVAGGALDGLPVGQQGAVERHRQAVRHHEDVFSPVQLRGGVRPEPGAVELDLGGVRRGRPHALGVDVWDI